MKLSKLLQHMAYKSSSGDDDRDVAAITFDSRKVEPGSLFVAIRGWERDGHQYVRDAVDRGAVAIVTEQPVDIAGPASILVENGRRALAELAGAFFDFPARQLRVIGVTGTDGKTTTTSLIAAMLEAAERRAGMLSTIGAAFAGQSVDTGLHTTTPDPVDVQRLLRAMVDAGMRYAVLETTSHALDQERTLGCEFDVAVVTNVTPEHLDYHRSYGRYLATKGRLFAGLAGSQRKPGIPKVGVANADDLSFAYLRRFPADVRLTYAIDGTADVLARSVDLRPDGSRFRLVTPHSSFVVASPLPGRYNVYNVLAAAAVALALGLPDSAIAEGAANIGRLIGRWDRIATGEDFAVVVDFAHTPRALEEALTLARKQCSGRVIAVFGCAGLRDRMKRPVMGEIAGRLADLTVLTAEDPRTEPVEEIISQIGEGCRAAGRVQERDFFAIADRAAAIDFAIHQATSGDLVLLAGKGHERSLCIGEVEHPWSEHEAVAQALARRRASGNVEEVGS